MSRLLYVVLVLYLLHSSHCAKNGSLIKPRIVGGKATTVQSLPYLVNLKYNGVFFCGGSLVSSRFVVTAAHCAKDKDPNQLLVVGGVTTLREAGVSSKVSKIMVSDKFNINNFNSDVAVLKLATDVAGPNIRPIPLCNTSFQQRSVMHVSGWGVTHQNAKSISNQMRTMQVPAMAPAKCKRLYAGKAIITSTMFCAARLGQRDACSGDSGGPAVHNGQLCGIVSWGIGCASNKFPGVYTNVNMVKSFILSSMQQ